MNINDIVSEFMQARAEEAAAKKRKEKAAALIIEHARGAEFFQTDMYNVVIDTRTRTGIDTERVYADFPEFRDVYGKTSTYNVITPKARTDAAGKTA